MPGKRPNLAFYAKTCDFWDNFWPQIFASGKKSALFAGTPQAGPYKNRAGIAAGPALAILYDSAYFFGAALAPPLPLKYLKNSELGSTTITSPLSLKLAR